MSDPAPETSLTSIYTRLEEVLEKRSEDSLYRSLQVNQGLIDFCSNDYLGFARSEKIKTLAGLPAVPEKLNGATGSRSISGNTALAETLEKQVAAFHQAEAGLIFNSGYDANLGLFSCIASRGDTIICDELIHASIIDGCRLSYANRLRFSHNNTQDLENKLRRASGHVFVAVESVYSMDGDMAPLEEIATLCQRYGANLIVDEAHATGVFGNNGQGLVQSSGIPEKVFARIHTFGKALGCHGAIVVGKDVLRNYLINFARSFIFTTALPPASLLSIRNAYAQLGSSDFNNDHLHRLIRHFRDHFKAVGQAYLINSISPVQSVVISGNERARSVSKQLQEHGFDVRAILSPSVPPGKERLRISLHMFNTLEEINGLQKTLTGILES